MRALLTQRTKIATTRQILTMAPVSPRGKRSLSRTASSACRSRDRSETSTVRQVGVSIPRQVETSTAWQAGVSISREVRDQHCAAGRRKTGQRHLCDREASYYWALFGVTDMRTYRLGTNLYFNIFLNDFFLTIHLTSNSMHCYSAVLLFVIYIRMVYDGAIFYAVLI